MKKVLILLFIVIMQLDVAAQLLDTKQTIQMFIDSIGRSNDMRLTESSIFPAFANGSNFTWRQKIWRNTKKNLLWVETIIPHTMSTVYFYCRDTLIFVSEMTYFLDSNTNKRKNVFRSIYVYQSKIIQDSDPGRNNYTIDHYLKESSEYLDRSKLIDQ